ncbi:MAG TPA: long-chain fatty acid--CoA ligase, partial [Ramlibacter sp.]|nr:long-chain fatty acid--CoA ligase [Ramlibacter sp.]
MNIIDAIRYHSRMRPYDMAVIHPGGAVTYLQLANIIAQLAVKLRSHGIAADRTAAIYVTDPFLHLALILACSANATTSISAHPNYDPIPAAAEIDHYIADRDLAFAGPTPLVTVGPNWIAEASQETSAQLMSSPSRPPQSIVRKFTSSGTTGTPKVIGYTRAAAHSMTTLGLSVEPLTQGPNLSMMGLSTIGGYGTANGTLWHGATLVLAVSPAQVLRAMSLYGVASLQASPQQLQGLVELVRSRSIRLPSLRRIEVGGATLPTSVALAARATLCPNVVGVYGATEAGGISKAPASVLQHHPDAAGYILPDVEVQILDDAGQVAAPGVEGVVRVRVPDMPDRYLGDPEVSALAWRDGWFHPGDVGLIMADGLLRITGRVDEMINAGGVKLSPVLVDDFLLTQPGIREAAAFAFRQPGLPDLVYAAVVCDEAAFDEQAVLAACRGRLNSRAPVRLVRL